MTENSDAGEESRADNNKSRESSPQSVDSNALIEALTKEVSGLRDDLKGQLGQATKKDPPPKLEKGQHIATVLGVPIAVFGFFLAAYTFTYTGEMQAEDAAYRAIQDHQKLRTELPKDDMNDMNDMSEWVSTLRRSPERINDKDDVSNKVFTQYDSLADHGLGTVEWIYRTRVTRNPVQGLALFEALLRLSGLRNTESDEGWKSTVESWIWEYRAAIYADINARDRPDADAEELTNFGWCDYNQDFVDLVQTSLVEREERELAERKRQVAELEEQEIAELEQEIAELKERVEENAARLDLAYRIPDRDERNERCSPNRNERNELTRRWRFLSRTFFPPS